MRENQTRTILQDTVRKKPLPERVVFVASSRKSVVAAERRERRKVTVSVDHDKAYQPDIEKLKTRDEKAWTEYITVLNPVLLRMARRVSRELAEDFVEEAWTRLYATFDQMRHTDVNARIMLILNNVMFSHLRRSSTQRELPFMNEVSSRASGENVEGSVIGNQEDEAFSLLLASLDDHDREHIIHFLTGVTLKAIARETGKNPFLLRRERNHALKALKLLMQETNTLVEEESFPLAGTIVTKESLESEKDHQEQRWFFLIDKLQSAGLTKYFRNSHKMTQDVFAQELGVSKSYIDKVETDKRNLSQCAQYHD